MGIFSRCTMLYALILVISQTTLVSAQDDSSDQVALENAIVALKEKLAGISDDIFLREQELESGMKIFQVIWEMDGETSKITLELRPLGQYDHKPVFGLFAYTTVAEVDNGSMPPAVIKAVATKNEKTVLGYFSMPESFDTVYMNTNTPSDTLTSGQLWMICAWLHKNRVEFKNEIDSILKATGQ